LQIFGDGIPASGTQGLVIHFVIQRDNPGKPPLPVSDQRLRQTQMPHHLPAP